MGTKENLRLEERIKKMKHIVKDLKFEKFKIKYISLETRYNTMMVELSKYSLEELNYLKTIFQNSKEVWEDLQKYIIGLITIFLTCMGLIYTLLIPILNNMYINNLSLLLEKVGKLVLIPCIVAIFVYMLIDLLVSRKARKYKDLLNYVELYINLKSKK